MVQSASSRYNGAMRARPALVVSTLVAAAVVSTLTSAAPAAPVGGSGTIVIDARRAAVLNRFDPARALGAGIDRMPRAAVDSGYRPETVTEVLAAGWQQVSYRLN